MKGIHKFMVRAVSLALVSILSHSLYAQTDGYAVTERGPNHKVWQRQTTTVGPNGRSLTQLHGYTKGVSPALTGKDDRVAKLKTKPEEQNEFNLLRSQD